MHGGEGQLLQFLSFILGWKWRIAFLLKVRFQVKDAADAGASLNQRPVVGYIQQIEAVLTQGMGWNGCWSFYFEGKYKKVNLISVINIFALVGVK